MADVNRPDQPAVAAPSGGEHEGPGGDGRSPVERGQVILLAIVIVVAVLQFGPAFAGAFEPTVVYMVVVGGILLLMSTGYQWAILVAACYFALQIPGSVIVGVLILPSLAGLLAGIAVAAVYWGILRCLIFSRDLNDFFRHQRGDPLTQEAVASEQPATRGLQTVYVAGTIEDAFFLKNLLEERGIPTAVFNAYLQSGLAVRLWAWEWTMLPRLVVNVENAAAARQMALDFDQRIAARGQATANAHRTADGQENGNGRAE
jgi:hypothetical protein